ncbi:DinB family protein [Chryseolinea lacunae]|uniref:DinB-like domain-containing protein n=1 Tax=Chryseolinea lacunae TaxID=2801331 RepID=A0ABS1KSJ6_9BACT|nr:hypothetical protein [Chryseolinea lacunae]MBL0742426.1 hypothetical protein [Chryseolinea lacunae]
MMTPEIEHLTILITRSYDKGAWHGPSVKQSIEGITTEEAHKRIPGTHSIIELVAHMAAWRTFVTRRLEGDASYAVTDEMNFPGGHRLGKNRGRSGDTAHAHDGRTERFSGQQII